MSDKLREKKTKEVRGTFIEKYLGVGRNRDEGKKGDREGGKDKSVWMCVCVRERERVSWWRSACRVECGG
jgi:hypothetical protein